MYKGTFVPIPDALAPVGHPDVLQALSLMRANHPHALRRFTEGDCYQLALWLQYLFPRAELWYDQAKSHVVVLIDAVFYDITGFISKLGDQPAHVVPWSKAEAHVRLDARNWRWMPDNWRDLVSVKTVLISEDDQ